MTPKDSGQQTVYFSPIRFPDFWKRIQQAAREASVREGRDVSASEYLALAGEEKMAKDAKKAARHRTGGRE